MEERSEKKNINKGLLRLLNKYKEGKLELTKEKGLKNILSNFSKKSQRSALNKGLSDYLINFIPTTPYSNLESIGIPEIKGKLIKEYYEAMQIPDELIKQVLSNMRKVDSSGERYYIHPGYDKPYKNFKTDPNFA
jgi:hypothetical protein